ERHWIPWEVLTKRSVAIDADFGAVPADAAPRPASSGACFRGSAAETLRVAALAAGEPSESGRRAQQEDEHLMAARSCAALDHGHAPQTSCGPRTPSRGRRVAGA